MEFLLITNFMAVIKTKKNFFFFRFFISLAFDQIKQSFKLNFILRNRKLRQIFKNKNPVQFSTTHFCILWFAVQQILIAACLNLSKGCFLFDTLTLRIEYAQFIRIGMKRASKHFFSLSLHVSMFLILLK